MMLHIFYMKGLTDQLYETNRNNTEVLEIVNHLSEATRCFWNMVFWMY